MGATAKKERTMERKIGVGLYWSEDGKIACSGHTPLAGSDTWRSGRWQAVPKSITHLRCEHCRSARRPEATIHTVIVDGMPLDVIVPPSACHACGGDGCDRCAETDGYEPVGSEK
jgi:hypothetical protein